MKTGNKNNHPLGYEAMDNYAAYAQQVRRGEESLAHCDDWEGRDGEGASAQSLLSAEYFLTRRPSAEEVLQVLRAMLRSGEAIMTPVRVSMASELGISLALVGEIETDNPWVSAWIEQIRLRQEADILQKLARGAISENTAKLLLWSVLGEAVATGIPREIAATSTASELRRLNAEENGDE